MGVPQPPPHPNSRGFHATTTGGFSVCGVWNIPSRAVRRASCRPPGSTPRNWRRQGISERAKSSPNCHALNPWQRKPQPAAGRDPSPINRDAGGHARLEPLKTGQANRRAAGCSELGHLQARLESMLSAGFGRITVQWGGSEDRQEKTTRGMVPSLLSPLWSQGGTPSGPLADVCIAPLHAMRDDISVSFGATRGHTRCCGSRHPNTLLGRATFP